LPASIERKCRTGDHQRNVVFTKELQYRC
jgi:hypothetical protein